MAGQFALYRLDQNLAGKVAVTELLTDAAAKFAPSYSAAFSFGVGESGFVAAYSRDTGNAQLFSISGVAPFFTKAADLVLKPGFDAIMPFVIGNQPHLMCYETTKGNFWFYPVNADATLGQPYNFRRTHEPGTTAGFTTVKPFVAEPGGRVAFLGYNSATGAVAIYTLTITATSPSGQPPLFALVQWAHLWAKGWTRFAFFTMGSANFFFKTNIVYENVNIDRILDDLTTGTIEVSTKMQAQLPDDLTIKLVEPLYFGHGEPHFISYMDDGAFKLFRFWNDCAGWDLVANSTMMPSANFMVPINREQQLLLLL